MTHSDSKPPAHVTARPAPAAAEEDRTRQAANRIRKRRKRLSGAPLAELLASIHEGHRY